MRWFLYIATSPKEIQPGLITSLNAAYTPAEVEEMLQRTGMRHGTVKTNLIGLEIVGSRVE